MGSDFYDTLGEMVSAEIRARPDDDSCAMIIAALATNLGSVIAITAGGNVLVVERLLTGCETLIANTAADVSRDFRDTFVEGRS